MSRWKDVSRQVDHRPWPFPDSPWIMTMSWVHLLAAHWPVEPELLQQRLPDGLTIDTWEGEAWLSVVPFEMDNTAPRGLTWWPRPMRFPELNLRTYVTVDGDKPGVWFFNLEAASRLAVWGARTFFHLPYFNAEMEITVEGEAVEFSSVRTHRGAPPAEFAASYTPNGPVRPAREGSFEQWVMERYCLYSHNRGVIYCGEVQHKPWPLRPATVDIETNTLFQAIDLELSTEPAHVHFAEHIDVLGWGLQRVDSE